MGGPVEFNLWHCLAGMGLAVGSGFLMELVARLVRRRQRVKPINTSAVVSK